MKRATQLAKLAVAMDMKSLEEDTVSDTSSGNSEDLEEEAEEEELQGQQERLRLKRESLSRTSDIRVEYKQSVGAPFHDKKEEENEGKIEEKEAELLPPLPSPRKARTQVRRHVVRIEDYELRPGLLSVEVGDEIEFRLSDCVPPHAEHLLEGASDRAELRFTSPLLQMDGDTRFLLTTSVEGVINIACKIYEDMICTVLVSDSSIAPDRDQFEIESSSPRRLPRNSSAVKTVFFRGNLDAVSVSGTSVSSAPDSDDEVTSVKSLKSKSLDKKKAMNNVNGPPLPAAPAVDVISRSPRSQIKKSKLDSESLLITVDDFKFVPSKIQIAAGEQVTFRLLPNAEAHKISCEGEFISITLDRSSLVYSHTFRYSGNHRVIDEIYGFMHCVVTVVRGQVSLSERNLSLHKNLLNSGNSQPLHPLGSSLRGSFYHNLVREQNISLISPSSSTAANNASYLLARADLSLSAGDDEDNCEDEASPVLDENSSAAVRNSPSKLHAESKLPPPIGLTGEKRRNLKKKLKYKLRNKEKRRKEVLLALELNKDEIDTLSSRQPSLGTCMGLDTALPEEDVVDKLDRSLEGIRLMAKNMRQLKAPLSPILLSHVATVTTCDADTVQEVEATTEKEADSLAASEADDSALLKSQFEFVVPLFPAVSSIGTYEFTSGTDTVNELDAATEHANDDEAVAEADKFAGLPLQIEIEVAVNCSPTAVCNTSEMSERGRAGRRHRKRKPRPLAPIVKNLVRNLSARDLSKTGTAAEIIAKPLSALNERDLTHLELPLFKRWLCIEDLLREEGSVHTLNKNKICSVFIV